MIRKMIGAGIVLMLAFTVVTAEEFGGLIRKVEGDKITIQKRGKSKGEKGEEVTLTVAKDVKVVSGKFNKEEKKVEAGEALEGGLKNKRFENLSEKGVPAQFVTSEDGKTVTEIRVFQFGGGKKKDAN